MSGLYSDFGSEMILGSFMYGIGGTWWPRNESIAGKKFSKVSSMSMLYGDFRIELILKIYVVSWQHMVATE